MSPLNQDAKNTSTRHNFRTGWLPPTPDSRDYSPSHPKVMELGDKLGLRQEEDGLPFSVDLRQWCTPIEDQGYIGSCTAQAAVSIVEYFQKKAFGKYFNGSRRFVYKMTRKLSQEEGDCGAQLRRALGALAIFGVPDEKYWYYTDWPYSGLDSKSPDYHLELSRRYAESSSYAGTFDEEPPAFVYSLASRYKANLYFCHDPQGENKPRADVLLSVKKWLAAGLPSMFGFSIYDDSFPNSGSEIPYPGSSEYSNSGHAVVAVGYDDGKKIRNNQYNTETTGALLIRNSWGIEWGDQGYGWLPYQYVLDNYATDFWTLTNMDWIDTGQFGLTLEEDSIYFSPPPILMNFGTLKVTSRDGIRIRSSTDTTNENNIIVRGKDTKDKTFSYETSTIKPIDNRIWVQIWNTDNGSEEFVGWMCVKEGDNQYTDYIF